MMMRYFFCALLLAFVVMNCDVLGQPLTPDVRHLPGDPPTVWLEYQHPTAVRRVEMATSADGWSGRHPMQMQPRGQHWVMDIRPLNLPFGRHEFKFIIEGEWESGPNRTLFINEEGLLTRSPDVIVSARVESAHEIEILLRGGRQDARQINVRTVPPVPIREVRMSTPAEEGYVQGYVIQGDRLTFFFNPQLYGVTVSPNDLVVVAGNFNNWDAGGRQGTWQMRDVSGDGIWELTVQMPGLRAPRGEQHLDFKFVINQNQWLSAPANAPNRVDDGEGNVNLRVDPNLTGGRHIDRKSVV